jgi:hypothetical protein
MAVSALVVTLRKNSGPEALLLLSGDSRFLVGSTAGGEGPLLRVPVVLDTASPDEDRRAHEWLLEQAGVAFVDVVAVVLDPEAS